MGHGFGEQNFLHWKKLENLVWPPCVRTSGQRKFAPLFEILNTPLGKGERVRIHGDRTISGKESGADPEI